MKLSKTITLVVFLGSSAAWKPFSYSTHAVLKDIPAHVQSTFELGTSSLLQPRQKPTFYADAMLELKHLEEKPICHRIAAQLLMSNCQGLEDISKDQYQTASASLQRHHVESFAASLAMCDMERAEFRIPESCAPFRSRALAKAFETSKSIDASPAQVSACLQGLGQDHSHWNTWLSYRDSALLLCRGARVEVEKDQMIALQKELNRVMEGFTNGLYEEMKDIQSKMASQSRNFQNSHQQMMQQADNFKVKMQRNFDMVTENIQVADSALKSVLGGTRDAYRILKHLVSTMVQSNAEMAAVQESALAASAKSFETNFEGFNQQMAGAGAGLNDMQRTIGSMIPVLQNLVERQNKLEESTRKTHDSLNSATERLQAHLQHLSLAEETSSEIHAHLEKVSTTVLGLPSGTQALDWVIRLIFPFLSLLVGNFNIVSTMKNNLVLAIGGLALAEMVNMYRHQEWCWDTFFTQQTFTTSTDADLSASSQLVAAWKSSIVNSEENPQDGTSSTPLKVEVG